jgi:catechol 2,3-dioxygenase-like lactoylglutathione lyase family enzyme
MQQLHKAVNSLLLVILLQRFALGASDQPQRPRITGIDHVTLYISDLAKSKHFYSDVLGFTEGCPEYTGPETCYQVRPTEQRFLLKPAPPEARNNSHVSWLAEVAYSTENVSQMRTYLMAHGLHPDQVQKAPDGARYIRVHDPEGNNLAFVERRPFKIVNGPGKQISRHLIHAGFVVQELTAENRFYVNLLGFRLYWTGGFKDDGTDWYELQVPDGPDWIEYMLNIPTTADHKELGVQNHFSFGVKDVHAAAAELKSRGYSTFDGPEVGRDGKDSLDAYDPDATRVEIMEFKPVQKPCCHPYTADHPKQ